MTFAWLAAGALPLGGVAAARAQLARLVSRDVNAPDGDTVRETAIETPAENLNDSVVAPLFWYEVAGLPGAVIYRFANRLTRCGATVARGNGRASGSGSWPPAPTTC